MSIHSGSRIGGAFLTNVIKITLPTPFKVGPVNVYVLKGQTLTLIDTGPKFWDTWQVFKKELQHYNLQLKDFDQIVLTHFHPDHVGLVGEILERNPVPVYCHPSSVPYLERDQPFLASREHFIQLLYLRNGVPNELITRLKEMENDLHQYDVPVQTNGRLVEGDRLPGEENWKVIETPGHSPDHISLYHMTDQVLIGGDHIIKHISSNAFVEPAYGTIERPRSLLVYREALKKLLEYPIKKVYAGHGEEVYEVHELILNRIRKQEERAKHIYGLLQEISTAYEISKKMFPHLYEKELPLTMSEVIGHIDLLVEYEKVRLKEQDGIFHYVLS